MLGPGENGGHSFTLSGEGNLHRQLLTQYWVSRAPTLEGWTFYPARVGKIDGIRIYAPFPRGDLIAGTSMNLRLINEYLASEGTMENPLAVTGADDVFVSFDDGMLPEGKQVDTRAVIEDELDGALRAEASGRLIGGGLGRKNAYIDLLLFDGSNSLNIARRVLREHDLPAGTAINFFAKESRDKRVEL